MPNAYVLTIQVKISEWVENYFKKPSVDRTMRHIQNDRQTDSQTDGRTDPNQYPPFSVKAGENICLVVLCFNSGYKRRDISNEIHFKVMFK